MDEQGVLRRTQWAGWSMAAGGALLLGQLFLGEADSGDARERLLQRAADPAIPIAKSLLFEAAALLILPGVAAIVGRVRGRGTAAVVSGGVVYGAGLVGLFSFVALDDLGIALAQAGYPDAALGLGDEMFPAAIPAGILAIFCFHLVGLPWLAVGMVRARQIPLWLAGVAIVGTGCAFFGSGTPLESVGWAISGAAIAGLGVSVARPGVLKRSAAVDPAAALVT